jgi:hypothetical protein
MDPRCQRFHSARKLVSDPAQSSLDPRGGRFETSVQPGQHSLQCCLHPRGGPLCSFGEPDHEIFWEMSDLIDLGSVIRRAHECLLRVMDAPSLRRTVPLKKAVPVEANRRENNGSYNPLERLDKLRENIQGSNNSLQPWTGLGLPETTPEQKAEAEHRIHAVVDQLLDTLTDAARRNDRAVVILTQADMFDPSAGRRHGGPCSHVWLRRNHRHSDPGNKQFRGPGLPGQGRQPRLRRGQTAQRRFALEVYGQDTAADDLQRITVDGSANATNYVKFTVAANSAATGEVLDWKKVPYTK